MPLMLSNRKELGIKVLANLENFWNKNTFAVTNPPPENICFLKNTLALQFIVWLTGKSKESSRSSIQNEKKKKKHEEWVISSLHLLL